MRGPRGFGGAFHQWMQEAQRLMEQVQRVEEEIEALRVEATAGGGVVKAVVNGKGQLVEISLAPEVVDPEDVEMLQDLVVSAVREAQSQAERLRQQKVQELAGGWLPPEIGLI